jgi:NAD(P)-dependent dehydrogenase (short-subunit alcohol dehydrogenase family)
VAPDRLVTSALVTGASSGIGRAIAADLLAAGWDVTAVARDPGRGGLDGAHLVSANLLEEDGAVAAVAAHRERVGSLDLLVNASGVGFGGPVDGYPTKRFDITFGVNIRGMFLVTREALPLLKASRGRIVNLASIAGLQAEPGLAVYAATKHAVVGLSRALSEELFDDGVRVTALCPGFVDTPMTDFIKNQIPAGQMVQVSDCVKAVRFLLELSPAVKVPELVLDGPPIPNLAE